MKLNKTLILWGAAVFLILAYIFSFAFIQKNDKRKSFKTAYVNSKYVNDINKFQLTKNEGVLFFTKHDGKWYVQQNDKDDFIPADKERIQKFLSELIKVRNIYKISDSINTFDAQNFSSDDSYCIKYQTSSKIFSELLFGKMDFAQISRYFMNGKSAAVYETDTSLDVFSSVSVQNWSDPNIVSKALVGNVSIKEVQSIKVILGNKQKLLTSSSENFYDICSKFLDLRHGGIFYDSDSEQETSSSANLESNASKTFEEPLFIELEFGNKSSADFLIEQKGEGTFKVHCTYKFEKGRSSGNSNSTIEYNVKISSWTYNKIKEIML